jgi:histidine triad (HIT) family protein
METIFTKIINRQIPAEIVYENENVLAFRDITPQATVHILVIPKEPLISLSEATSDDVIILGELLLAVKDIAVQENFIASGYRVVINNGAAAGQSVFHLHLHILSGRPFSWPPG